MEEILAQAKVYVEQAKAYSEQTKCYMVEIKELLAQLEEKKRWLQDFVSEENEKREQTEKLYREVGNISAHMGERFAEIQELLSNLKLK